MQRETTWNIEWVAGILAFCFLGLALPVVGQGSPTMHILNLGDEPINSIWLDEDFSIGLENMTPGANYEIRFVDSVIGQVWGSMKLDREVKVEQLQTLDDSWGISLRRILAGCATLDELEEQGIFWEESFRYSSYFSALQAAGGKTFRIELYNDPQDSFSGPLAVGDLSIFALDGPVLTSDVAEGCYNDLFLAGNELWAEDVYATYADGIVVQNGWASTGDVYVVTEWDYRAGPSAWREVRSAYADSPQQISLPQGQDARTFKLWDASDTVVGAYRVIVVPVESAKQGPGGGIEANANTRFTLVGSDIVGPGTIAPSIWKCPSGPPETN